MYFVFQKLVALRKRKEDEVFESEEQEVTSGEHDCSMIVCGHEVKVEPVNVKFYTFESDIYIPEGTVT